MNRIQIEEKDLSYYIMKNFLAYNNLDVNKIQFFEDCFRKHKIVNENKLVQQKRNKINKTLDLLSNTNKD
ncbi:hypothetical protein BpHYR1_006435 [Brachionus plicatilis]|uniref:Uncharacterized protein n=1 Tax=Brachionus plicatilis TaxID=10195 RepID=A0A3M7SXV9_BRAPC|nr:hypothetical protein BpHYR1_006435 [Brachionus plicatilis]